MQNALVEQFSMLWRPGEPPPNVFDFLDARRGAAADERLAVVLRDQKILWRAGRPLEFEQYLERLPGLAECLAANIQVARLTSPGVRAAGACLNTSSFAEDEARALCAKTAHLLGLPCTDPHRFGVEAIIDNLLCPERSAPATIASR